MEATPKDNPENSPEGKLRQHYLSMLIQVWSPDTLKAVIMQENGHLWTPDEPGWIVRPTCWISPEDQKTMRIES